MNLQHPVDVPAKIVLGLLVFLSVVALLPWNPHGPFDARDWTTIEGVNVEMLWIGIVLEPYAALLHVITGAPDFRIAALSFGLWVVLVTTLVMYLRRRDLILWRRVSLAVLTGLFGFWFFFAALLFYAHVHFPGWTLTVDDRQWLVADLQSHTLGSHDGLARAEYNLRWHAQRGYDVVAVTEHDDPTGSFYAESIADAVDGVTVIPGIELANEYGGYILGLGLKQEKVAVAPFLQATEGFSKHFTELVTRTHDGAVIAMAWRMNPAQIDELVGHGVHAFELINQGHPDIPVAVRETMLRHEQEGRIRLVSSTDWHGWGGGSRTWTLLQVPYAEQMTPVERKQAILTLLREGDRSQVIPVVAGYHGPPHMLRAIFSPPAELVRYAAELSPLRLLSWWLWIGIFWLLARRMREHGYCAGRVYLSGVALLMGGILLVRGLQLHQLQPESDIMLSTVTKELGMMAMYAAIPIVVSGLWLLAYEMRRHRGKSRHD